MLLLGWVRPPRCGEGRPSGQSEDSFRRGEQDGRVAHSRSLARAQARTHGWGTGPETGLERLLDGQCSAALLHPPGNVVGRDGSACANAARHEAAGQLRGTADLWGEDPTSDQI